MARDIDEKRLQKLLAAGKSQREIAGELGIPHTSLQKIMKQLEGSPAPKTPAAVPVVPAAGPPVHSRLWSWKPYALIFGS